MSRTWRIRTLIGAAGGLVVIAVLVVALVAFGGLGMFGGNLNKARRIAIQLQAEAVANPNPTGSATPSPATPATAAPSATNASARGTASKISHSSVGKTPASSTSSTAAPASAKAAPVTPSAAAAKPATATAAKATPKAATSPAVAPLRQPTSAEIAQAIVAVHSVVKFFTPTPADIASAGVAVCGALNKGESYSQVQAAALDMVGIGSYAWAVPSSVTQVAIQTVVALYCPANASRVSQS